MTRTVECLTKYASFKLTKSPGLQTSANYAALVLARDHGLVRGRTLPFRRGSGLGLLLGLRQHGIGLVLGEAILEGDKLALGALEGLALRVGDHLLPVGVAFAMLGSIYFGVASITESAASRDGRIAPTRIVNGIVAVKALEASAMARSKPSSAWKRRTPAARDSSSRVWRMRCSGAYASPRSRPLPRAPRAQPGRLRVRAQRPAMS